ncbi:MAG: DegV family protein [Chloroflexota bacterium]|nr:DegV family protein [Chloroflexota bacterium]
MSSIAIVSDSTAGLSDEYVERHHISIVPLYINMNDKMYREGIDMGPEEFYKRLPHSDPLPKTSQPSAGDFREVYSRLEAEGVEGILSVHLSSKISGTINSATLAAKEVDVPVEIVDTQSAAAAHLLAVEVGVKAVESGADLAEAAKAMRDVLGAQKTLFVVDTLEYLYKGGRIGGAAALMGSLLQFKPLLYFRDGEIDALERVRTSSRAYKRMAEVMAEWMGEDEPLEVVVMEAGCPERLADLAASMKESLTIARLRESAVPAVLGAHAGDGTVGVCCCPISVYGEPGDSAL